MFVLDTETRVIYPTTIKVTLSFVNEDTTPLDLNYADVTVVLKDISGHEYQCIWKHDGVNGQHTKLVDGTTNQLMLLIEGDYNLHGKVYSTGSISLTDPDFSGDDVIYYPCDYTKLIIDNNGCEC